MKPVERVRAALEHRPPDRIPAYFGGTSTNLTDTAYFEALRFWNLGKPVEPYRFGHTGCYVDNRILEVLEADVRMIQMKIGLKKQPHSQDTLLSDWAIPLKMTGGYASRVSPPLGHLDPDSRPEEASQALEDHPWPEGTLPERVHGLRLPSRQFQDQGYAVVGRSPQSAGFLEYGCWLRGDALFYMDMMLHKDFVHRLLDRILDVQMGFYKALLSETGEYLDIVETAEDYGTQASLLISPDLFREFIKPRRQKLNRLIRSLCPSVKILHHSCGAVEPLIRDLIDTGVDILHPLQPGAGGMDPSGVKDRYGTDCCFCGGIDMLRAMQGTREEVRQEVALRIRQFRGQEGGFLLAPSNHIQSDTPLENLEELFRAGRSYDL